MRNKVSRKKIICFLLVLSILQSSLITSGATQPTAAPQSSDTGTYTSDQLIVNEDAELIYDLGWDPMASPSDASPSEALLATPPEAAYLFGAGINWTLANSAAELRLLIQDNTTNYIKLTQDITLNNQLSTIGSKTLLVIDGGGFTLSENPAGYGDLSRIVINRAASVTLQNMTIRGRNYYGTLDATVAGSELIFDNVIYTGPQLTQNVNGKVVIRDSNITIKKSDSTGSPAQEVAECSYVVFEGNSTITHTPDDPTYSCFWISNSLYQGNLGFYVAPGGKVTINTVNYLYYGDSASDRIDVDTGGAFVVNARNGFHSWSTAQGIKAINVMPNAKFEFSQGFSTRTDRYGLQLDQNGSIQIADGGEFIYQAEEALHAIRLQRGVTINAWHPGYISIYNKAVSPIRFMDTAGGPSSTTWNIENVQTSSLWTSVQPTWAFLTAANVFEDYEVKDGWYSKPEYYYFIKEDNNRVPYEVIPGYTILLENKKFVQDTLTQVKGKATDQNDAAMALTSPEISTLRRIVFGNLNMSVNTVGMLDNSITGTTDPNVKVNVTYKPQTGPNQEKLVTANATGGFTVDCTAPAGSTYSLDPLFPLKLETTNNRGLFGTFRKRVNGTVVITQVDPVQFRSNEIPSDQITIQPDFWDVVVEDYRADSTKGSWRLTVSAASPLTGTFNGNQVTMPNALQFNNQVLGTAAMPVWTEAASGLPKVTYHIGYVLPASQGMKLVVGPYDPLPTTYTANLNWILEITP